LEGNQTRQSNLNYLAHLHRAAADATYSSLLCLRVLSYISGRDYYAVSLSSLVSLNSIEFFTQCADFNEIIVFITHSQRPRFTHLVQQDAATI
jgi:hypothetical protein